jgi:hypothetical protein
MVPFDACIPFSGYLTRDIIPYAYLFCPCITPAQTGIVLALADAGSDSVMALGFLCVASGKKRRSTGEALKERHIITGLYGRKAE